MGSSYSATLTYIQITNTDGSLTIAHGSFNVIGNNVLGGTITSLDHRSTGGTIYEEITGTSIDAQQFLAATPANKLASALSGTDDLFGHAGLDTLNGYGGADHMTGGDGDDFYVVDSTLDVATEFLNQGFDTISTSLSSYALGANLERLLFTGTGTHTGYGNNLDNDLNGGAGKDTLYGYGGNDSFGSGGGGDTFFGGDGNDVYFVVAGDTIVEQANEGTDQVQTSLANYVLPPNVEFLSVSGSGPEFGNGLDNTIQTNGASGMTIYGLDGNDRLIASGNYNTLIGGNGNDRLELLGGNYGTMTGGSGDDVFVIRGAGHQAITDFAAGSDVHDRIDLQVFRPGGYLAGQNPLHNFSDVLAHATQNGADTVINFGAGNSLTLQNVQKSALNADDFVWSQAQRDFNGDNHSDALLIGKDGSTTVWDSGQAGGAHQIADASTAANGWHVAGTGDFDGNGQHDIVWVNDNGGAAIWDNGQGGGGRYLADPGALSNGWHFAGAADFDGNGKDDILWVNDNGGAAIWDNGQATGGRYIAGAGALSNGWHFAGTGDFDANRHADIVWINDNGAAAVWDNGQAVAGRYIANPGTVANGFHFAGIGNLDGNGGDDILWVNDNGNASISDGINVATAYDIGNIGTGAHFGGVGDFDGNGQSDILWQNDNGAASIWDNAYSGSAHSVANPGAIPDGWHIV
jgi:Ca2+-binding RTX toxin-like protein